jgi:hypothetical protein
MKRKEVGYINFRQWAFAMNEGIEVKLGSKEQITCQHKEAGKWKI